MEEETGGNVWMLQREASNSHLRWLVVQSMNCGWCCWWSQPPVPPGRFGGLRRPHGLWPHHYIPKQQRNNDFTTTNTAASPEGYTTTRSFTREQVQKSLYRWNFMYFLIGKITGDGMTTYLAQLVVSSQVLFILAASFGPYQHHVPMVFGCGHIAIGGLQLIVEGGGRKAQRVQIDVLVSRRD